MQICNIVKIAAISSLSLASFNILAADTDYKFVLGGSVSSFDTSIQLNAGAGDNNDSINLEDALGYDSSVNFFLAKLEVDFNNKHKIAMTVLPFSRSSSFTIDNEIEFEGDIIQADANVNSKTSTTAFDFEYSYLFASPGDSEFEAIAGVYWMSTDFKVNASGLIENEDGEIAFDANYQNSRSVEIPLPLFGLKYRYNINETWQVEAGAKYFGFKIENVDGKVTSLMVSTEYKTQNGWGLGASVSYFDLDVNTTRQNSNGQYIWKYSGLNAYAFWEF